MSVVGRPRGKDSYLMTEEWKAAVRAVMLERGIAGKDLAREVGLTPGGLSRLLTPTAQGGMRSSSKAVLVGERVGVPLPTRPTDTDEAELLDALREIRSMSQMAHSDLVSSAFELRDNLRKAIKRKPRNTRSEN